MYVLCELCAVFIMILCVCVLQVLGDKHGNAVSKEIVVCSVHT